MKIPSGRIVWGALLALGGIVEAYGIMAAPSDDTLSEFTRWAFQVDSPAGRAVFLAAWGGFATWFTYHILSGRKKK